MPLHQEGRGRWGTCQRLPPPCAGGKPAAHPLHRYITYEKRDFSTRYTPVTCRYTAAARGGGGRASGCQAGTMQLEPRMDADKHGFGMRIRDSLHLNMESPSGGQNKDRAARPSLPKYPCLSVSIRGSLLHGYGRCNSCASRFRIGNRPAVKIFDLRPEGDGRRLKFLFKEFFRA